MPSEVPDLELEVLVGHLLHVEADGGDGGHNFADLSVKTHAIEQTLFYDRVEQCYKKSKSYQGHDNSDQRGQSRRSIKHSCKR